MSESTPEAPLTVADVPEDQRPLSGQALDDAKFAYDTRVALSLGTPLPQRPSAAVIPPYKAHLNAYLAEADGVDGSSSTVLSTAKGEPGSTPSGDSVQQPEPTYEPPTPEPEASPEPV